MGKDACDAKEEHNKSQSGAAKGPENQAPRYDPSELLQIHTRDHRLSSPCRQRGAGLHQPGRNLAGQMDQTSCRNDEERGCAEAPTDPGASGTLRLQGLWFWLGARVSERLNHG